MHRLIDYLQRNHLAIDALTISGKAISNLKTLG